MKKSPEKAILIPLGGCLLRRLLLFLLVTLVATFGAGCGNSNNDFVATTNTGNSPATGSLVFNFVRAQTIVPVGTQQLKFDFFDADDLVVLTETRDFAPQHAFEVPSSVVRVEITSLALDGFVLGTSSAQVTVTPGSTQDVTLDVEAVTLTALAVSPSPVLLQVGGSTALTLTATFSDGSTQAIPATDATFQGINSAIATLNSGTVTGVAEGETSFTASFTVPGTTNTVTSATVTVTVTPATLESLTVTPNPVSVKAGGTVQLAVNANFSDSSVQNPDLTTVVFAGNNTGIATISPSGLVTGVSEGTTSFTASFTVPGTSNTVTTSAITINITAPSLDAITASPDPINITTAGEQQITIQGEFSDGTTTSLNPSAASYSGASSAVANIDGNGLVSPVAEGTTSVTVGFTDPVGGGTVQDTIDITVVPDVTLDSLTITPDPVTVAAGLDVQLSIVANFSNGSMMNVDAATASYNVLNPAVATIDSNGLLTGLTENTTTFTVSYTVQGGTQMVTSDPIDVTVTAPVLQTISVDPDEVCVGTGGSQQLTLQGIFSDGSNSTLNPSNASYSGNNTSVATVSNGLVTPVAIGTTTVTVNFSGVMSTVPIEVVGPALTLSGANTFDTDTGQLNGSVPGGWDGSVLKIESFELPAGATLTISGSAAFQVEACGDVTVAGTIDASGGDGGTAVGATPGAAGTAGPGGAVGGIGGGTNFANQNGADGSGPGGGGGGVTLGPDFSGNTTTENGGGGAGHSVAGEAGFPGNIPVEGSVGAAGAAYTSIPTTLLGGSGGGGGSCFIDAVGTFSGGGGGGGGGGVVSLSADGMVTVSGTIDCSGGVGGDKGASNAGAGGGGGSGGSILLVGSSSAITGDLDVGGGAGGDGAADGGAGADGRVVQPF